MKMPSRAGFALVLGWLCVLAIGASGQTNSPLGSQAKISGGLALNVIDTLWTPVAKAKITITDANGVFIADGFTDRQGKFSISQIPIGGYLATAHLEGYGDRSVTFIVREHHVTEFTIHVEKDPPPETGESAASSPKGPDTRDRRLVGDSAFTLTVKDQSGAVIPGAAVSIEQIATGLKVEGKTGGVGEYHLADLAAGQYSITVIQQGFRQEKFSIELHTREDLRRVVALQAGPPGIILEGVSRDGLFSAIQLEPTVSEVHPEYFDEIDNLPTFVVTCDPDFLRRLPLQSSVEQSPPK
jgi:hypothetical protein